MVSCVLVYTFYLLSLFTTNIHKKQQSNVVITPPEVTPSQSVAPPLPGRSDCPPTKPQELSDCSELKKSGYGSVRCSYYDNIVDPQAGGITNCDCVRDQGFRCRQATGFTFSF